MIKRGPIAVSMFGKRYKRGEKIPWLIIYPFFLIHMGMFGFSGFLMAYGKNDTPIWFLYLHGGFAIFIYTIFYISIFGWEEIKWLFINSLLGLFGIYSEINFLLSKIGKTASDFPIYIHVIPFLYYVLYTFLLRQAIIDIANAREKPKRKKIMESAYVIISVVVYTLFFFKWR